MYAKEYGKWPIALYCSVADMNEQKINNNNNSQLKEEWNNNNNNNYTKKKKKLKIVTSSVDLPVHFNTMLDAIYSKPSKYKRIKNHKSN